MAGFIGATRTSDVASGSTFVGLEIDKAARKSLRALGHSLTKIRSDLMKDIALYWHTELFPAHFTPGAETRYGYEKRTKRYMEGTKRRYGRGQGKYVSNLFTGESRRRMTQLKTITGTSNTSTVRMDAPAYFRKAAVGTFTLPGGKSFTIKRQPDKAAEVTRVNAADLQKIRTFASTRLQYLVNQGIKASKAA